MQTTGLIRIFAELYPDQADAKRLSMQADLPSGNIDFSGTALQIWTSVLEKADMAGRVVSLVDIAKHEYSDNVDLNRAAWDYVKDLKAFGHSLNGQADDMYGYEMYNQNGNSDLYRRLSELEKTVRDLAIEVAILMRASSGSNALDTRTLLIAVAVAAVMLVALYALRA